MALEAALHINQLDPNLPDGALDDLAEGDDVLRLIKSVLLRDFPNIGGIVTVSHTELNTVAGKANKAGDTYAGTHNMTGAVLDVATPSPGDSSSKAAPTSFVSAAIGAAAFGVLGLTLAVVSATTYTAASGEHVAMTNAGLSTLTLPASPTAGAVVAVTFTNGLLTNVINPNGNNIQSTAGAMTVDKIITVSLRYINPTIGWAIV